jgi:predicted small metal-binding protein
MSYRAYFLNRQVRQFNPISKGGNIMERYSIDCRDYPGDVKCSVALSADTKEELLEVVVQHGEKVHGYKETPEFRENIVKEFKKKGS